MNEKRKKETKLEELERRIQWLENLPVYYPPNFRPMAVPQVPNMHFHNGNPCCQKPCIWSGV